MDISIITVVKNVSVIRRDATLTVANITITAPKNCRTVIFIRYFLQIETKITQCVF